jgi:protein-S-isoprenylcysteine O-methyltransferase Ste14
MNSLLLRAVRSAVLGTAALLALIFIPAGTLDYWQGIVYAALFIVITILFTTYLATHDSALLERRMQAGPSHEREPTQEVIMGLALFGFFTLIIVPALDHRFGWSPLPPYISIAGDILVVLGFYVFYLVVRVNSFAAANIRVEEGQIVVTSGPYALVRHPMYSGALLLLVGTPLALGSWWGLFIAPVFLLVLVFRILNEEKVLVRDLSGYVDYQKNIRYRLVPYLW